ncbi:hypothetical protein QL285_096338 [Trifolium repens]|nr:hypothetical protein QL285_096338 [Trifolium repens]
MSCNRNCCGNQRRKEGCLPWMEVDFTRRGSTLLQAGSTLLDAGSTLLEAGSRLQPALRRTQQASAGHSKLQQAASKLQQATSKLFAVARWGSLGDRREIRTPRFCNFFSSSHTQA